MQFSIEINDNMTTVRSEDSNASKEQILALLSQIYF